MATIASHHRRPTTATAVLATVLLSAGMVLAGLVPARRAAAADPTWARYAPLVYLHPDEVYLPMTVSAFLDHSRLRWSHDGGCPDHQLAATGQVDAALLGSGGYQHREENTFCQHSGDPWTSNEFTRPRQDGGTPGGEGFFLDMDNSFRAGTGTGAPVYYDYAADRYVTYWFFYGFDDAPTSFTDHEGDWERISIRLGASDQPVTVAFFEHSGYCVLPWASVTRTTDGHPVAYSARGTHASYPAAGSYGIGDEAAAGPKWSTWTNLRAVRSQPWYGFGGAWGEVGDTVYSTGPLGPSAFKSPVPSDWSGPAC